MHLPGGWLVGHEEVVGAAVALVTLVVLVRRLGGIGSSASSARVAATAALVFALQMVSFPVADGTSGHVLGAALAVALLGGELGILTVTGVLVVQCLAFADGGVSALGLNVLNIAIVPGVVAALLLRRGAPVFVASLASVSAGALAFSVEYAIGGVGAASPLAVGGDMLAVHAVIALAESAVVAGLVWLDRRVALRPAVLFAGALLLAALVAPWASPSPDGLQRVAIDRGFASFEQPHPLLDLPTAGYEIAGVGGAEASTALAGVTGVLGAALLAGGAVVVSRRRAR